tara:strand:- start:221 stop:763 length:543 start_codon:yes stop_codon:yes gene_type:complete
MKKIIIIILFFFTNSLYANEREQQLNQLFIKLKYKNFSITSQTEQKIWDIWSTHPTDQNLTKVLKKGSKLVREQQLIEAVKIFSKVIDLDPNWAEAWNKRATVFYLLGKYKDSQKDIDKVLELEERHFGALAGQGLVNIELKNYEKAIKSYQRALEIYPNMQSPYIMIREIEALIKEDLI